jgi:hypothetical protein
MHVFGVFGRAPAVGALSRTTARAPSRRIPRRQPARQVMMRTNLVSLVLMKIVRTAGFLWFSFPCFFALGV